MQPAILLAATLGCALAQKEFVPLFNAAAPGQTMPAIGLGTGGYGTTHNSYNSVR